MTSRAMKAGAIEFLPKPFQKKELLEAIHQALDRDRTMREEEAGLSSLRTRFDSLTEREREVMGLVVTGLMNKEVGARAGRDGNYDQGSPRPRDAENEGRLARRLGKNGGKAQAATAQVDFFESLQGLIRKHNCGD